MRGVHSHTFTLRDSILGPVKEPLQQQGADCLKVYGGLSRDSYFAIIDAAKRVGLSEEVMLRKKVDSNSEWCWMLGSRRNKVSVVAWDGTQAEVTGL